ncbi:MAG: type IV pilus biogenesis/stability protein PilW [Methylococcales bacterium]|nr:type IV pilus biogenesis/stability protein PilW [Methylococcales bacterium]
MLHIKSIRLLFLALLCVLMSACISSQSSKKTVSDKEKAALNLQLGRRYLEMNMLKAAKDKLEDAVDLDEGNAGVYNALGVLHERLHQYEIAGEKYKKAIKLDEDDSTIQNNYGRFLCERGDSQLGLVLLKNALNKPLNKRKWFAYTNIGRCELRLGNQELAESNFRQALQENNIYSPVLFEMQKISYQTKKYMSSRAFLQRYLAVAKHTPKTLWYAIQTEQALGNSQLSEKYREQLLTLFPISKEAQQLKKATK